MKRILAKALDLWSLNEADVRLVAARENHVFEIGLQGRRSALRLHRKGYRTDPELRSELQWMAAVSAGGIDVPAPVASRMGAYLHVIDDTQVDMLSWSPGVPLIRRLKTLDAPAREGLFYEIGRQMAALHDVSDAWTPPNGFVRCLWDRAGLLGEAPLWGRFWDNPLLSVGDRHLFYEFRKIAAEDLAQIEGDLDFGLIHADLVGENILVDRDRLNLIDFDDGGFGFRLFDIATALIKYRTEADYPVLRTALLEGYQAKRRLNLRALDLFLSIRAATYLGWNIARLEEEGAAARNERFATTTRELALQYLDR